MPPIKTHFTQADLDYVRDFCAGIWPNALRRGQEESPPKIVSTDDQDDTIEVGQFAVIITKFRGGSQHVPSPFARHDVYRIGDGGTAIEVCRTDSLQGAIIACALEERRMELDGFACELDRHLRWQREQEQAGPSAG